MDNPKFDIVGLNYVSVYLKDLEKAIEFYTKIFGSPENNEPGIYGWKMGDTWLTFFPAAEGVNKEGNPCNTEYAICVGTPDEVDRLHKTFIDAGAKNTWTPEDTWMYESMRFCCVDDPFGMRIDIYCPIPKKDSDSKEEGN